jgi:ABC-type Fe3+/spermidine/putrescine transport system ATPase subunit
MTAGQRVQVAIRQESIRLARAGGDAARVNRFPVTVAFHAFAGQAHHYVVQLADGRELEVATPGADTPLERGTAAFVEWAPEDVIVLPGGSPADSAGLSGDAPASAGATGGVPTPSGRS